jgi:hypothetical protein
MVEETARRAAHVDILREIGDDGVGDHLGSIVDEP